jgi:hypothetical protein
MEVYVKDTDKNRISNKPSEYRKQRNIYEIMLLVKRQELIPMIIIINTL